MARSWRSVPDADPNGQTIAFPAVYDGVSVLVTATAYGDQIDLYPVAGHRLEIKAETWESVSVFLTIASHARRPPEGTDHGEG